MNQGGPPPPYDPRAQAQLPVDLPQHARERIADMRARRFFTSDLSVNEFLLVKQAGFDPLGLVMGSSIYQIAPRIPQVASGQPGCEVAEVTRALYHARELAMNRMEEEAEALGADGIVGVRLHLNLAQQNPYGAWGQRQFTRQERLVLQRWYQQQMAARGWAGAAGPAGSQARAPTWQQQQQLWANPMNLPPSMRPKQAAKAVYAFGQNITEFLAVGTAVRHRDGKSFKNVKGKPFQSDLSGQDFWTLLRSGYRPCGFVMGNCVYYVPPHALRAFDNQSGELPACTHALYDARELAIERLQWEAEQLGATGIVGVTVTEKNHAWRRWNTANATPQQIGNAALQTGELLELFVIGTAVVPMEGASAPPPSPTMVLAANDAPAVEGAEE